MPYKNAEKVREVKRLSAQRRRAKATEEQAEAERKANADQMARKRAIEGHEENATETRTGIRSDVATWAIANGWQRLSGEGWDYGAVSLWTDPRWWSYERNGCQVSGRPRWWKDGNEYQGDERKWVLYSIRLTIAAVREEYRADGGSRGAKTALEDGRATEDQGRAAEARGREIWSTLYSETEDVRRVAGWARDGLVNVPSHMQGRITSERVEAAIERLKAIGICKPAYYAVGAGKWSFRIQ